MKILIAVLLCFALTAKANAFLSCTTQTMGLSAALPAEGADPVVSGTNIYAAYNDAAGLEFAASHDNGTTWTKKLLDANGVLPRLAVAGQLVYVAWYSRTPQQWVANFSRSSDGGLSFSATTLGSFGILLSSTPNTDGEMQMVTQGQTVAIIWRSTFSSVTVATSADAGRTFSRVAIASPNTPLEESIAISGQKILAVWNYFGSTGLTNIATATSSNGGQTFGTPVIRTLAGADQREPLLSVSAASGAVYMIWREAEATAAGATVGYFAKSTDFGVTWSTPTLVDPGSIRGRHFSIVADDPNISVTYLQYQADGWHTIVLTYPGGNTAAPLRTDLGNSGFTSLEIPESYASRIWNTGPLFSLAYLNLGQLYVVSSSTSGQVLSRPVLVGAGTGALMTRNTAMWISPSGAAMVATCQ
jgi:hypothetical protein